MRLSVFAHAATVAGFLFHVSADVRAQVALDPAINGTWQLTYEFQGGNPSSDSALEYGISTLNWANGVATNPDLYARVICGIGGGDGLALSRDANDTAARAAGYVGVGEWEHEPSSVEIELDDGTMAKEVTYGVVDHTGFLGASGSATLRDLAGVAGSATTGSAYSYGFIDFQSSLAGRTTLELNHGAQTYGGSETVSQTMGGSIGFTGEGPAGEFAVSHSVSFTPGHGWVSNGQPFSPANRYWNVIAEEAQAYGCMYMAELSVKAYSGDDVLAKVSTNGVIVVTQFSLWEKTRVVQ